MYRKTWRAPHSDGEHPGWAGPAAKVSALCVYVGVCKTHREARLSTHRLSAGVAPASPTGHVQPPCLLPSRQWQLPQRAVPWSSLLVLK